jgi:hypothetical protein
MFTLMKSENPSLYLFVVDGVALFLTQMLNPGADDKGLNENAGLQNIFIQ